MINSPPGALSGYLEAHLNGEVDAEDEADDLQVTELRLRLRMAVTGEDDGVDHDAEERDVLEKRLVGDGQLDELAQVGLGRFLRSRGRG